VLSEVSQHGSRWLVLDVRGIANDALLRLSEDATQTVSGEQEEAITRVMVAGLQEEGIPAELHWEQPRARLDTMQLIVPVLRLYLPLKEVGRDFYAALIFAIFAYEIGAPPGALGKALVPSAIAALARRLKGLDREELEIVKTLSALRHQMGVPVTGAQLSSSVGRNVGPDLLRLSERSVIRSVEGGWVIDF
jgi:hypothetical protein